jgi:RHS repeat-associated protein
MYQIGWENTKGEWVESKHIFVGDTRIVTKRKNEGNDNYSQEEAEQYFYHGDHLGSAQMVTDHNGQVYEHLEYTPYGELWVEHAEQTAANVDKTVFRFTGKERDGETGLYYYGARYLNPQTGLWLSTDPAMGEYVPQAPINDEAKKANRNLAGMGGVFNVVNLHVYHYAGNNPMKYTDPDGRISFRLGFGKGLAGKIKIGIQDGKLTIRILGGVGVGAEIGLTLTDESEKSVGIKLVYSAEGTFSVETPENGININVEISPDSSSASISTEVAGQTMDLFRIENGVISNGPSDTLDISEGAMIFAGVGFELTIGFSGWAVGGDATGETIYIPTGRPGETTSEQRNGAFLERQQHYNTSSNGPPTPGEVR